MPSASDRARRIPGFHREAAGGLKALVAAEREARGPSQADSAGEAAAPGSAGAGDRRWPTLATDEEFAVVVTRRSADGGHEAVAV